MGHRTLTTLLAVVTLSLPTLGTAVADEHAEKTIAQASSAAPEFITKNATFMDRDGKVVL